MKRFLLALLVAPLISCALLPGSMRTLPPETQIAHEAVIVQTAVLSIQTTIISFNESKMINDSDTRKVLDYIKQVNSLAAQLKSALELWHQYGISDVAKTLLETFKQAVKDLRSGVPLSLLSNPTIKANIAVLLNAWS